MSIELDHIFILTQAPASRADQLLHLGLAEGASNRHQGQGTANRRFFLNNTCLEFLYVCDEEEALRGPAKALRFLERSNTENASPFGLIMRTEPSAADVPFKGWKYCPDYFTSDQCFHVGSNSGTLEEPLCIVMPLNLPKREDAPPPENPDWLLTELCISVPGAKLSNPLAEIAKCHNITVKPKQPHRMELTFNNGAKSMRKDFTSDIPLVINW